MSIEVRGLTKRFGPVTAIDDVSFDVPTGSLTALLGPSGGGKSTVLRIIAGLETLDGGTVLIEGQDVTRVPAKDRGIGFCFQHYAPFRHMTVFDNVAFGLKIRHRPKAEIRARVHELLELVRLEGMAERYPSQLSGGQRQRMALARALAVEPKLLLLDEPFGALDAQVRRELRTWLRDLHEQSGVTTVLVTHDQEEAMEIADNIAIIQLGRLAQVGSPADCYEHPNNDFVLTFLGPATKLGGEWVRPHDLELSRLDSGHGRRGTIRRILQLGFEVRVELTLDDTTEVFVQIARRTHDELALLTGEAVFVTPAKAVGELRRSSRARGVTGTIAPQELLPVTEVLTARVDD